MLPFSAMRDVMSVHIKPNHIRSGCEAPGIRIVQNCCGADALVFPRLLRVLLPRIQRSAHPRAQDFPLGGRFEGVRLVRGSLHAGRPGGVPVGLPKQLSREVFRTSTSSLTLSRHLRLANYLSSLSKRLLPTQMASTSIAPSRLVTTKCSMDG